MNNKGQMLIGGILVAFIGVVVGLLLYTAILPFIGTATGVTLKTSQNQSIIFPAAGGTVELTGQELVGSSKLNAYNLTVAISTTNYTLAEGVKSTGVKGIILTAKAGKYNIGTVFNPAGEVNITYSYYPDGYIDNAGARSVALR